MKYDEKIQSLKEIFESPGEVLKRELALYRTHSGKELADEIAATNPSLVLDLGCGSNIFKKLNLRRASCLKIIFKVEMDFHA